MKALSVNLIEKKEVATDFKYLKCMLVFQISGDHVYVRSGEDRPYIARIDKMWMDNG